VRTSALAGGHYCVAAHTVVALDAGLDRREVTARGELPTAQVFTLLVRAPCCGGSTRSGPQTAPWMTAPATTCWRTEPVTRWSR